MDVPNPVPVPTPVVTVKNVCTASEVITTYVAASSAYTCVLSTSDDQDGTLYNTRAMPGFAYNVGRECFVMACPGSSAAATTPSSIVATTTTTTTAATGHPFSGFFGKGRRLSFLGGKGANFGSSATATATAAPAKAFSAACFYTCTPKSLMATPHPLGFVQGRKL